jgi:type VI secretion system protein ImpF
MPALMRGSLAPLLDRLIGTEEASLLDAAGLRVSLVRDLERLFNSTSRLGTSDFIDLELTVLDYGLPDFRGLSPQSYPDRELMAGAIGKAIATFEPRLTLVQVTVDLVDGLSYRARVAIEAAVRLGNQLCRVDFDLEIMPGAATTLGAT